MRSSTVDGSGVRGAAAASPADVLFPREEGGGSGVMIAPEAESNLRPCERRLDAGARPRLSRNAVVGALDLGTTKICCMIGRLDSSGKPELLGVGQAPSRGLKRGMVSDIGQTVASIRRAVSAAQTQARREIRDFHVGIAGGHLSCVNASAMIEVANPARGVSRAERARVLERVAAIETPEGREIIHVIPQEFVCDGQEGVANPVGMCCSSLQAKAHVITAAVASARNVVRAVQLAGCRASGLLIESLASSRSILTEDEKEIGVLLLDIGGGTTDAAVFQDGAIQFSGVVPLGGESITRDLSRALKVSWLEAEHLKRACGGLIPGGDFEFDGDSLAVTRLLSGRKIRVKREFAREVVEARCEEILSAAREMVDRGGARGLYPSGVVLTGGSSLVDGIEGLAERVFRREARVGSPGPVGGPAGCPDSPIYATALGLLLHGLEEEADPLSANRRVRLLGRVYDKFMKMIDWYS
jgi:cell division protein FtsA